VLGWLIFYLCINRDLKEGSYHHCCTDITSFIHKNNGSNVLKRPLNCTWLVTILNLRPFKGFSNTISPLKAKPILIKSYNGNILLLLIKSCSIGLIDIE
jgi:hypothetical protein